MRGLVNVALLVMVLSSAACTNRSFVRPSDGTRAEVDLFLTTWLRIPGAQSLDRWLDSDFRLVGAAAASLRAENLSRTDAEVIADLPWACEGSENSCPSIAACTRPMRRRSPEEAFEMGRLLVNREVVAEQPALAQWRGESLVEVDLVLSRCGTGVTLLFHSASGRLTLVAALVAAN